jgi:hypothetical protein
MLWKNSQSLWTKAALGVNPNIYVNIRNASLIAIIKKIKNKQKLKINKVIKY